MRAEVQFGGRKTQGQYSSAFPRVARSVALFCPFCFSVWASITETDSHNRTETHHFAESVPCAQHRDLAWNPWQIGGSLLERESNFGPAFDLDILEALPKDLLARELDLHISHWEKHQCSPSSTSLPVASVSLPEPSVAGGSAGIEVGSTASTLPQSSETLAIALEPSPEGSEDWCSDPSADDDEHLEPWMDEGFESEPEDEGG